MKKEKKEKKEKNNHLALVPFIGYKLIKMAYISVESKFKQTNKQTEAIRQ